MARTYSRFNGSAIGTGLELLEAGRVVTTESDGLSIDRSVLSTIGQDEFSSFAEFIVYSEGSPSISNKVSIGITTAALNVNTEYVGESATSIGYRLAEGQIRQGGSTISSVTAGALGSVVGVLLSFADVTAQVSFYLDGVLLDTIDLPSGMMGETLYYAVSLGSTDAGDIIVWHNTGARRFEHPITASDGWWTAIVEGSDIRISTRPFLTASDDDFPAVQFDGCIMPVSAVLTRSLNFWPDGDVSSAEKSALVITINNTDGQYTELLGGRFRDVPVALQSLELGDTLADAETLGSFVFDRAEAIGEGQLRLTFVDDSVLLERPAQRRYFRPDAAPTVAGAPWPTVIGACFSVELPCYDLENLRYAIDSEGALSLGKIRDKGDPLDPNSIPPDYIVLDGGQAVELTNEPEGTVTGDASVTGASYTPPTSTEILTGDGCPFVDAGGGDMVRWDRFQDDLSAADNLPRYQSVGRVRFPQNYLAQAHITHDAGSSSAVLEAGKTYLWQFTVDQMAATSGTGVQAFVGLSAVGSAGSYFQAYATVTSNEGPFPKTFNGTYSPAFDHGAHLWYYGNNVNGGTACIVSCLTITELPPEDNTAADDAVENALPALNLTGMVREIMARAELPDDYWSSDDTDLIDNETLYRGSGTHRPGQWVPRELLNDVLSGYSGAMYKDEDGLLRFTRLVFPEEETSSQFATHTLRKSQMLDELLPIYDDAPGLTNTIACRRNFRVLAEGELVTDEIEVTMALRRKLAREFRFHRSSGAQFAPGYEHAVDADPLRTALVDPLDAQNEIERVAAGYGRSRSYYQTRVMREDCPPLGAIVAVYYDEWGFSMETPVNLRVKQVAIDFADEQARTVLLWGLSPEELM